MEIWARILEAARGMTALEIAGVAFNLGCVILTIRRHVWCWPVGIVGSALFVALFYRTRLYPDMMLNIYFIVLSVYGWWNWVKKGPEDGPLVVSRPSRRAWYVSLAAIAVLSVLQGFLWKRFSNAAVPYLDSTIMVASVVAQWMLAKKWLENWTLWIAVDAIAVPVYWSRSLYLLSILYFAFLCLAVAGYVRWRRAWRESTAPSLPEPVAVA